MQRGYLQSSVADAPNLALRTEYLYDLVGNATLQSGGGKVCEMTLSEIGRSRGGTVCEVTAADCKSAKTLNCNTIGCPKRVGAIRVFPGELGTITGR